MSDMKITVNNIIHEIREEDLNKCLMDYIREDLDLTGTKNGCGIGVCGSCTVLVDGKTEKSCKKTVADVIGRAIVTIEGMEASDGTLHPLQQAFIEKGAIQCGFCTPGMVLTGHALLTRNPEADRGQIAKALNPVLCRCTGYKQIIDAVESVKDHYKR